MPLFPGTHLGHYDVTALIAMAMGKEPGRSTQWRQAELA